MTSAMELDVKGLEAACETYDKEWLATELHSKATAAAIRAYLTASGLTNQIDDLREQLQSSLDRLKELERERDHWESRANDRGLEAEKWFRKYGQHLERADALAAELEKYKTWFEMKSKSNAKALAQLSQVNLDNVVLREALRPFAELAENIDPEFDDNYCPSWAEFITYKQFRAARAALSNQPTASKDNDHD